MDMFAEMAWKKAQKAKKKAAAGVLGPGHLENNAGADFQMFQSLESFHSSVVPFLVVPFQRIPQDACEVHIEDGLADTYSTVSTMEEGAVIARLTLSHLHSKRTRHARA